MVGAKGNSLLLDEMLREFLLVPFQESNLILIYVFFFFLYIFFSFFLYFQNVIIVV